MESFTRIDVRFVEEPRVRLIDMARDCNIRRGSVVR
jgi:hypothetical protein